MKMNQSRQRKNCVYAVPCNVYNSIAQETETRFGDLRASGFWFFFWNSCIMTCGGGDGLTSKVPSTLLEFSNATHGWKYIKTPRHQSQRFQIREIRARQRYPMWQEPNTRLIRNASCTPMRHHPSK